MLPGHAAQQLDDMLEVHAVGRLAVDRHDAVARLDAGAGGGRAVDRRDHLGHADAVRDADADAAEPAVHRLRRLAVFPFGHVVGVRIEAGEHALERVGGELVRAHRANI